MTPTVVAQVLADAFSASERTPSALVASASAVLGSRRAFVVTAAAEYLRAFPRPLPDSPRLVAAVIEAAPGFAAAVVRSDRRAPLRIAVRSPEPTEAVRPEWGGPTSGLHTVADLARALDLTVGRLEWFADTRGWNRRAPDGPLQHYRYEWRTRTGRTPRLLEVPRDRLRAVQRQVLDDILAPMPLHDAAHGFVRGRSAVTGASAHTGRDVVVGLDLVSFFASVPARRVYGLFRRAGLPEAVAHLLTGLCTHAVPARVLAAMPPGGSADERFALRRALQTSHLPQGAPTSPALANLSLARLDARLDGWAEAVGATYTRYADDLAFSGDERLARRLPAFLRGVDRIVVSEGHSLNPRKTRVRPAGTRQTVTGVVVNQRTAPVRPEYDALKALLRNCALDGPAGQNRAGVPDFRAHLLGRIAWVEQLHPERGARLRERFAAIRW